MASDVKKHSENPETVRRRQSKGQQIALNAHMALEGCWNTPCARDGLDSQIWPAHLKRTTQQTPIQMLATGHEMNGLPATTEKRGAPNPAFPCWLMGYPDVWLNGADWATQSCRPLRRKSSPR